MIVLLLGNGFDLNHKFPTSYINFLNTVTFLRETDREKLSTVGHVFGNEKLQKKDPFMESIYKRAEADNKKYIFRATGKFSQTNSNGRRCILHFQIHNGVSGITRLF